MIAVLLPADSCQGKEVTKKELELWTAHIFSQHRQQPAAFEFIVSLCSCYLSQNTNLKLYIIESIIPDIHDRTANIPLQIFFSCHC